MCLTPADIFATLHCDCWQQLFPRFKKNLIKDSGREGSKLLFWGRGEGSTTDKQRHDVIKVTDTNLYCALFYFKADFR